MRPDILDHIGHLDDPAYALSNPSIVIKGGPFSFPAQQRLSASERHQGTARRTPLKTNDAITGYDGLCQQCR